MSSPYQIAQYAFNAGWRGQDLVTAVAVALAESRFGDDKARGDVSLETAEWGPSIGLWQIRSLNAEKGKGTLRDEVANLDPQTNANHAFQIWKQSGWGPWTTHNNKTYLLYVGVATPAVSAFLATHPIAGAKSVADAVVPDAVKNAASTAASIAEMPIKILKWLTDPGTITRIAKVVLGGALMVVAFEIIVKPVVEPAVKTAAKTGELAALL